MCHVLNQDLLARKICSLAVDIPNPCYAHAATAGRSKSLLAAIRSGLMSGGTYPLRRNIADLSVFSRPGGPIALIPAEQFSRFLNQAASVLAQMKNKEI